MTDTPPIRALDDVRPDPKADLAAAVDESLESVVELARMMSAEYAALVAQGVPPIAAATITGQRWRMTS